jgi:hypothetical protein
MLGCPSRKHPPAHRHVGNVIVPGKYGLIRAGRRRRFVRPKICSWTPNSALSQTADQGGEVPAALGIVRIGVEARGTG